MSKSQILPLIPHRSSGSSHHASCSWPDADKVQLPMGHLGMPGTRSYFYEDLTAPDKGPFFAV